MSKNYLIFVFLLVSLQAVSQHSIRGIITDAVTNQPISGVEVTLSNSRKGTISYSDGSFTIEIVQFPATLFVSHLSYETSQFEILEKNVGSALSIGLIRKSFELEEINILSDVARERFNPISFNSINSDKIITTLGDKPLPEVMNFLPSVYGIRNGGGSGDATLSIRGFQQENIAVLLNGVPINGAENGLVYWNNWMGLTEITSELQVQRGIGASKVALNSVGGTMNIITQFPKTEAGGTISFQSTNYGNKKLTFSYNTGISDKGWALSFLGSRTQGEGYIDATYVDGWGYFMNLSKEISAKQRLVITLLGGPERHGQRNMMLTQNEMDTYGYKYNKEWGSYNGELNNASENFYHKPHLALTHYMLISEKSLLATSVYVSPGWGGGKWNDSFNYGPTIFDFRNPS
ncbi:MAG: carboxypeptidase-like regulatory domain-containing protein, partial [Ignavibacteria bacterium]|nr:carboxypeptidase-like regulatory domain-containing protein [Ignavibacteria bacterium]